MRLKDLIDKGAFIDTGVMSRKVTWEGNAFDVLVKSEMSAADYEFIYLGLGDRAKVDEHDKSLMARRVHRLVRIGPAGEDAISYEDAARMKHSLLMALCVQINEVHRPPEEGEKN